MIPQEDVRSSGPVWILLQVQVELLSGSFSSEGKRSLEVPGARAGVSLAYLGCSLIYCFMETGGPKKTPPLFT